MSLKKFFVWILILVIFLSNCFSVMAYEFKFDINKDGEYNIRDVTSLQRYLLKYEVDINMIDVNGDGKINIVDATYIQRDLLKFDLDVFHDCTIVVNGVDISDDCYAKYNGYTNEEQLPLLAIAEALGLEVEWKSNEIIYIKSDDKKMILDITEQTLIEENGGYNLLGSFGSESYFEVVDNEVIVDFISIRGMLRTVGAEIGIDRDHGIFYVGYINNNLS